MFKVGDRVRVIRSVAPPLIRQLGTVRETLPETGDSTVYFDNKNFHYSHNRHSGRAFINEYLQLVEPTTGEAEWE